jgi:hypothetical protein
VSKSGFNISDLHERRQAQLVYEAYGLIDNSDRTYPYFCQMSRSILLDEVKQCISENKPAGRYFEEYRTTEVITDGVYDREYETFLN